MDGLFAGTPPLEALRLLVSDAATANKNKLCGAFRAGSKISAVLCAPAVFRSSISVLTDSDEIGLKSNRHHWPAVLHRVLLPLVSDFDRRLSAVPGRLLQPAQTSLGFRPAAAARALRRPASGGDASLAQARGYLPRGVPKFHGEF